MMLFSSTSTYPCLPLNLIAGPIPGHLAKRAVCLILGSAVCAVPATHRPFIMSGSDLCKDEQRESPTLRSQTNDPISLFCNSKRLCTLSLGPFLQQFLHLTLNNPSLLPVAFVALFLLLRRGFLNVLIFWWDLLALVMLSVN